MTIHRRKRILVLAIILLALANIAAVAGFLTIPIDAGGDTARAKAPAAAATMPAGKLEPLSAYTAVCQRDLRSPLIEPVVVKAPPPPKPSPPKLNVTLVGTAVDPGYICGFFRLPNGQTQTAFVGQKVEEAEVLEIGEGTAILKYGEQTLSLTVDKGGRNDGPGTPDKVEPLERVQGVDRVEKADGVEKTAPASRPQTMEALP